MADTDEMEALGDMLRIASSGLAGDRLALLEARRGVEVSRAAWIRGMRAALQSGAFTVGTVADVCGVSPQQIGKLMHADGELTGTGTRMLEAGAPLAGTHENPTEKRSGCPT